MNTDGAAGANNLDSPGASGSTATRMRGVQGGQNFIRSLFNVDSALLEIYSPESATNKFSIYAQPVDITFSPSVWVNRCDYTITLKGQYSDTNDISSNLESVDESWDTQEAEDGSATLVHKIQAKGRLVRTSGGYNSPLGAAKQWVNSRLYNTSAYALSEQVAGSGIMYNELGINEQTRVDNDGNFSNRARVETTNPFDYTFAVTETFLWTLSTYKEEWNATVNFDTDWPDRATIAVNGSLTGLAQHIYDSSLRMSNASGTFATFVEPNLYTRAVAYAPAGYTVNPVYLNKQYTYDVVPGNMRYSIGYSALKGGTLVSGALDENITISDTGRTDIFAQIAIPGRIFRTRCPVDAG